jgi:tetratricopeptide (TPR) repeat protein
MLKKFVFAPVILVLVSALAGTAAIGQSREEGLKLYHEGQALYNEARSKEDLQRVVEKCEQALKIFENGKFYKGVGDAANILGVAHARLGQYSKAVEYWEKSLEVFRKLGDLAGEGTTLNNLGLVYADWGRYSKAVECYDKSLGIKTKLGDVKGEGATLNNLGNVYRVLGQHSLALKHYARSLEIAEKLGDRKAEAGALNSMGLVHKEWGQYPQASEYYERSLGIATQIDDLEAEGRSLNNLGNLYANWGRYSKSVNYYLKSLDLFRKLGDPGGEGDALNNLGLVYADLGQYSKALEYYEKSLAMKREQGDLRGEGQILNNLGLVYADSGQYPKAADYYLKSLEIFKQLEDMAGEADAVGNLGNLYNVWGQYSKAAENYERLLGIAGKLGDLVSQGNALNNLGLVYSEWGQYPKAMEYYEKSLAIKTKLGDVRGEGTILMNTGGIHVYRGEYEKALANFQSGLAKYEEVGVPLAWPKKLIGDLYLDMGDAEKAEPFLKDAGHNSSLGRLHLVKSDYQGAKGYYEKLREIAEKNRDVENLFTAYTGLGMACEAMGEENEAEEYFSKAVSLSEDLRSSLSAAQRERFFDVRVNGFLRTAPYDGIARVRVKMNRPLEAFKDSEYTKSRVFAEALSKRSDGVMFDIPADILKQDRDLNDELAALKKKRQEAYEKSTQEVIAAIEPQVEAKERERKVHIRMLREEYPLFAATKYPQPTSLDQTALKDTEWVLTYHVTDSGIIIYLTRGKEIVKALFRPIARDELDNLVLEFRKPVEIVPGQDDFNEKLKSFDCSAGKKLSDLLLSEILHNLPHHVAVIVVPDGALGMLPFEMLVLNDKGAINTDKHLPYVVGTEFFGDRNLISYSQSITALSLSRIYGKSKSTEAGLLAIADPVFQEKDERAVSARKDKPPTGVLASLFESLNLMSAKNDPQMGGLHFSRLTLTADLAKALAEMHKKNSEIYTGFAASKENFLVNISPALDRYDKIIFATHGYFGKDLPGIMEPVLVLTLMPPGTDGFLRMTEVMSLNIHADIVALTACQSGLGKRISGEGTMGMGRAFQYAGARSVLMSLWSVSEVASVNLVSSFFRNLKEGKSKSEALALARADLRKKGFDHPFFWAAFILVGEAD